MRANLDLIRPHIGVRLDQWYLITIAIEALKKIKPNAWIESFKKVNLHPQHDRVSFDDWLKKIDSKLSSGEFFASRTSLFDAMPAVWKNMSVQDRHDVVSVIDSFYRDKALDGKPIWTTSHVLRLVKYVPLGDVGKLRACYLAAKRDPSVFVFDDRSSSSCCPPRQVGNTSFNAQCLPEQHERKSKIDMICSWRPDAIIKKYKEDRTDKGNQLMFFHHITNFVATQESSNNMNVKPAAYLNAEMNAHQIELLKPTHKNVIMGSILKDAAGKGALQLIAKRRIDMMDGNIGSYSRLLNSTGRMEMLREVNALAAAVALISKEKVDERSRTKKVADQKASDKVAKQKAADLAEGAHRSEVMPHLKEMMAQFESGDNFDNVIAFSATMLKDILKFYFNARLKGMSTMKKSDLVIEVTNQLIALRDTQASSLSML